MTVLFLAMMTLASCQGTSVYLPVAPIVNKAAFPDIPAADKRVCLAPGYKAGQNALSVIKRYEVALIDCSLRHQRVVKFYNKLQSTQTGEGAK